ncbi:short chain dehydrogenase [Colletotrichum graminicola]|uniref:Short chain dehydrogenase n=1 Tax=Colletotrichum graminicola (strain M1.001 / M2 / FGSC 10212) TaxID=645133 RepID=E3QGE7_COLGM|nr:short chain dehydrogenase [Colletotrichum graminicola M1.001]EFQ29935.1 short chain dehydrogenase [Colletotrichum graminicola M1.001]WDK09927.1 short chain dehydrogenase [Colletotrichum graminicola]
MDYPRPPQNGSWFAPLSIDLLVKVFKVTFFHPFISWIIPLCFRAQARPWDDPLMVGAIVWAAFITLCWMANVIDQRIAYGLPREVDLSEEVIVITGGASGVGLLIAEVYGMRGATVAVLDVNEMENGEARGVTFYKCDVTDKAQVARVAAEIEKDLGAPTVLINNAAIVKGKSLLDLEFEDIDKSITTNLTAHFYTLKTFLPPMIRAGNGGTIVTMSSVLGHLGAASLTDYTAAKAGVTALHKSLTAELATSHPDIRTILVEPGQLSTPLFYGVQTPHAFIAPIVEPVDVCKEIIAAIDAGRSAHVAMPLYARWIHWYNVLPPSVQQLARKLARVDTSMQTFIGRQERGMSEKNGRLI